MSSPSSSATISSPLVERRLSGFLQLAPTTSPSYPQTQRSRQQQQQPPQAAPLEAAAAAAPPTVATADGEHELVKRRSSSVGSDGSKSARFLKLGPVHWGEHMEDHQGDFVVE